MAIMYFVSNDAIIRAIVVHYAVLEEANFEVLNSHMVYLGKVNSACPYSIRPIPDKRKASSIKCYVISENQQSIVFDTV